MAERNPDDLPPATEGAQEDVFSAEPRSYKMDRRSPEASALREAVSRKLLDFLGSYSDDVLTEYIIVLVCNGKHQNQARDDLEAFLGKESKEFVAWLWDYLSIQHNVSKPPLDCLDEKSKSKDCFCDTSNTKKNTSYANNIEDSDRCNDFHSSEICCVKGHTDGLREQTHTVYEKVRVSNSNQSASEMYMDGSLMSSTRIVSGGEQCLQSPNQQPKIAKSNSSALPCQSLHVSKTESVARSMQPIVREDVKPNLQSIRSSVSSRPPSNDVDVVEAQVTRPRGNVWDRLGKPCKDNGTMLRGERHHIGKTEKLNYHVEELQRSMVVEPFTRLIGSEAEKVPVFDKGHKMITSNNHLHGHDIHQHNKQGLFEQVDRLKRMQSGGINSGNTSASFSGSEEVFLQDNEAFQKTKGSLSTKRQCLPRPDELATDAKSKTGTVPEQAFSSVKFVSEIKSKSDKVVQTMLKNNHSATPLMQNSIQRSSSTLDKSKCINHASGNNGSRPMQNELLDIKVKLQQVEENMHKLRSKQADLNNSKSILSPGPQNISKNISKEDVESRTVFVTNVHFAASREALVSHFTKCGAIIKVTMLTDTTGQPKGEAYIVFANKESVDKAISLSGTSFFSRILMVSRKSEMPSGSSMPTQPAMKLPQQQWYSPHKKGAVQRHHTSSHFQWKRDESVSRESSAPASTNRLESSNAGE